MSRIGNGACAVRDWFHKDLDHKKPVHLAKVLTITAILVGTVALAVFAATTLAVPALAAFKTAALGFAGALIIIEVGYTLFYAAKNSGAKKVENFNTADDAIGHINKQLSSKGLAKKIYNIRDYNGQPVKFGIIYSPDKSKPIRVGNIFYSDEVLVVAESLPAGFEQFLNRALNGKGYSQFISGSLNGKSPFSLF